MDIYAPAPRLLHWLIAAIVIPLILVGLVLHFDLAPKPARHTLTVLHISFGLTVLALMVVRLAVRLTSPPPPLPAAIPARERQASRLSHRLFYALLFAMPLFGITFEAFHPRPIPFFWLVSIPIFLPENKPISHLFASFHFWGGMALIALLLVHVAAVIHHDRQGVPILQRMWK
jgi:cytochrome b561